MPDPIRLKGFDRKPETPSPAAEPPPVKSTEKARAVFQQPPAPPSPPPPAPVAPVAEPAREAVPDPVEEPVAAAPEPPPADPACWSGYEPDTDEMRVWKRQNWKWTLYEKSGLREEEEGQDS